MQDPTLSLTHARWAVRPVEDGAVEALVEGTGLSPAVARVFALRQVASPVDPADWLAPSIEHLHDPHSMRNMDDAVDRLRRALVDGDRIRVVTDYDVDGTTSSLILQAALRLVRPDVQLDYHIPNRFGEGYGFSEVAARQAAVDGIDLVVTADIGVRDHGPVATARNSGVDVLICDHHLPQGATVPDGATVLCPPQQGCTYPNRALAACGVSLKLAQALLVDHPRRDEILRSMLKLAAVGTVADMVPLNTLENRAIVTLGLAELNQGGHHPGLAALIDVAGLSPGLIQSGDLGYRLGPRINAAGRVADATLVVELLTTRDAGQARALARRLEGLNTQRKDIQRRLVHEALDQIGDDPDPFVLLAGDEAEGWHRGVVGIVAARVKDEVHRPVAVVSIQGDRAVGSVRSVPGIHAVQALDSVADLLVKYGGHPAAAGFTVPTADLDEMRERLGAHVESLASDDALTPLMSVDAELQAHEVSDEVLEQLRRLGPFGIGNPRPLFLVQGVRAVGIQIRGKQGTLLKFRVPQGDGRTVEAVWWDRAELADVLRDHEVDLLVHLGENVWRGQRELQLDVADARISAASS